MSAEPEIDPKLKEKIEKLAEERAARDQASVKFGFVVLIVMVVLGLGWTIYCRLNPDAVSEALTEITLREVDLPESRLTYAIDGAPVLEPQWNWELPAAPFPIYGPIDILVVDKSGESVLVESEEGDRTVLVIAADKEVMWSAVCSALRGVPASETRSLWLATRTSKLVGTGEGEMQLREYERSQLGVVPVRICPPHLSADERPAYVVRKPVGKAAGYGGVVKAIEMLYTPGRSVCALPVEEEPPPPEK